MTAIHSAKLLPHRSRQSGFSLIEVMVTLLVLSIGLLGVAALQVVSLQYSSTSLHRSIAVIQANDLVERLWANVCVLADEDDGSRNDIRDEWDLAHSNSIPGRSSSVAFDGFELAVTIGWSESRVGGGNEDGDEFFNFFTRLPELPECDQLGNSSDD